MQPAIRCQGLVKQYGPLTALDHLSLEIKQGEFFGLLGVNGAGKTTFLHAVVGLVQFQAGSIAVFGHDVVSQYRDARRMIGISPQDLNFDRFLSIEEILVYQAGYHGIPAKQAIPKARELLERFDLADKAKLDVAKLSGGMKRRLSLARALITGPKLLILDEPTAGMDVELRQELWHWLEELHRDGMTMVLTSHYLEEVERTCQRIAIIDHGKLLTLATKDELLTATGSEQIDVTLENGERMSFPGGGRALCEVVLQLRDQGLVIEEVHVRRKSLEDIFLELTGRR